MERGNPDLGGNPSVTPASVIVAKELFDAESYAKIIEFMDTVVPMMPVSMDEGLFVRHYAHNVPFFKKIHEQLVPVASELFGEPLKASYVFLSMYKDNGICPLHIDRPQCYRTIDYLIRTSQTEPWPIHIGELMTDEDRRVIDETGQGHPDTEEAIQHRISQENWTTVTIEPNEAVCYSGTHQWHYRSQRLVGTADLAFFHFVPEAFDGPLD